MSATAKKGKTSFDPNDPRYIDVVSTYVKVDERPIEKALIPDYSQEEHGTWKILIETQKKLYPLYTCKEFSRGVEKINFRTESIPPLKDVSSKIAKETGWTLMRVEGLVHPFDFFTLLAKKVFPSTDFIRHRKELKYTPAPDMFHDLFGHCPLLCQQEFCEFFQDFGKIGVNALKKYPDEKHELNSMLATIYWYTVEFGCIRQNGKVKTYGSGAVSSPDEIAFTVSEKCQHLDFNMDTISHKEYDIWQMQKEVFVIESWKQLGDEFRNWASKKGIW